MGERFPTSSQLLKPSPDPEREELRAQIQELSRRVAALEERLDVPGPPPAKSQATPSPAYALRPPTSTEGRLGVTVVNRIGAVTLAIGIIFFFKYAVDNRWIGATGRVLLGVCIGTALVIAADWLRWRQQQAFAQGIAGCGVAIVYISLYAGFAYYSLIPFVLGYLLLLAISAAGLGLSFRFASTAVAGLGFICALMTPGLLERQHELGPAFYFSYLLFVEALSIVVSIRLSDGRISAGAPVLLAVNGVWIFVAAIVLLEPHNPGWFCALFFAMAALHFGASALTQAGGVLGTTMYSIGHASTGIAFLRALALWAKEHAAPAERASVVSELSSVLLAFYAVALIAVSFAKSRAVDRAIGSILLAIVIFKLYFYDVWLLTRFYRISAFVALGVLLLLASFLYSRFKSGREAN